MRFSVLSEIREREVRVVYPFLFHIQTEMMPGVRCTYTPDVYTSMAGISIILKVNKNTRSQIAPP